MVTFAFLSRCLMPSVSLGVAATLVITILTAAALILFGGRATALVTIISIAILAIGVVTFAWGPFWGTTKQWDSLQSVATLLAVVVALLLAVFQEDLRNLRHHPAIKVRVEEELTDNWDNKWWIRGEIKN